MNNFDPRRGRRGSIVEDIVGSVTEEIERIGAEVRQRVRTAQTYRPPVTPQRSAPVQKEAPTPSALHPDKLPGLGGLLTVLGVVGTTIGSIFSITSLSSLITGNLLFGGLVGVSLFPVIGLIGSLAVLGSGIFCLVYGSIRKKKKKRFMDYLKLIGDKTAVPIHYLADVLGIHYQKVIKDLREMISLGILAPAWIDMKTYRLMLTDLDIPQEEQPQEKPQEAISRSDRILRQIRADNDLIDDPEVSRKIDRIEDLTRKIFTILEERPEKEPQLYSFLNYYLPTTLKALENYARLEAQGIETASIREAKQKINNMLDELADGYEKQLDRLFENDVIDISADIEVMRQMLRQDGLTEDEIVAATQKK